MYMEDEKRSGCALCDRRRGYVHRSESSRDTDLNCSCLRQSRGGNAIRSHARVDKAVSPLQTTAALIHRRKPVSIANSRPHLVHMDPWAVPPRSFRYLVIRGQSMFSFLTQMTFLKTKMFTEMTDVLCMATRAPRCTSARNWLSSC